MENNAVPEKIKTFIKTKFPVQNDINDKTDLLTELLIDSAAVMDIIIFLEEEFKIDIGRNDMIEENFENIKVLSNFVVSKISKS